MQRLIPELVEKKSWEELANLLRENDYNDDYDLNDVKALVVSTSAPDDVKHIAFLHLIGSADLATLKQLAQHVNLMYRDADDVFGEDQYYAPVHPCALFLAVLHGREDVMDWLKGELTSADLNQKDLQCDLLVAAASGDHIDITKRLLKPIAEDGFGCTFDAEFFESTNKFPFCTAAYRGNSVLLRAYIKPENQGGFGLRTLFYDMRGVVTAAIYGNQLTLLQEFLVPESEGGFGFDRDLVTENSVLEAMVENHDITLALSLVRPIDQGGWFGMAFELEDFLFAVPSREIQFTFLPILLKPISEGGLGMILPDEKYPIKKLRPDLDKKGMEKKAFALLAVAMFKQILKDSGLTKATQWFNSNLLSYTDSEVIREITDLKNAAKQRLDASVVPFSVVGAGGLKRPNDDAPGQSHPEAPEPKQARLE